MKTTNRIVINQPDYLFTIVRRPADWQPKSPTDVPGNSEVLAVDCVASFAEAYDDLIRCNQISLERDLNQWSVIQCPDGNL